MKNKELTFELTFATAKILHFISQYVKLNQAEQSSKIIDLMFHSNDTEIKEMVCFYYGVLYSKWLLNKDGKFVDKNTIAFAPNEIKNLIQYLLKETE